MESNITIHYMKKNEEGVYVSSYTKTVSRLMPQRRLPPVIIEVRGEDITKSDIDSLTPLEEELLSLCNQQENEQ